MAAMIACIERRMTGRAHADRVGRYTAWRDTQGLGRDLDLAGARARGDQPPSASTSGRRIDAARPVGQPAAHRDLSLIAMSVAWFPHLTP